jgi:Sec-independent protein translocase protein TatA
MTTNIQFLGSFFGEGETMVLSVVFGILLGSSQIPRFARGLREMWNCFREAWNEFDQSGFEAGRSLGGIHGKPAAEALTTDNKTVELYDPALWRDRERTSPDNTNRKLKLSRTQKIALIIAITTLLIWAASEIF